MTDAPLTELERWALNMVRYTQRRLRRAVEPHDICAQLRVPGNRALFRAAVRRLQRKGYIAEHKPAANPLRITARGRGRAR